MGLLVAKNNILFYLYTIDMDKLPAAFIKKAAVIGIAAFIIFNFGVISGGFTSILTVLKPVFIGLIFALILNVPTEFFETKVLKKIKKDKFRHFLSLTFSVVIFAGVLALIFGLAVPAGVDSIKNLVASGDGSIWDRLKRGGKFLELVATYGKVLYDNFTSKIQDYLPKMLQIAQDVFKFAADLILGLGIAIMLLANKKNLTVQAKKLLKAVFKDNKKVSALFEVTGIALNKFSRYLGGQVIEAVVLGAVCYVCMVLIRLPYAALISLIIGFVNLIPIVGAYIGGAIGAVLIFSVDPTKALIFVIFIVILQQVEAFTTYPVIVGKYVGLNSFWIMVSIVVWGGLFGFAGMLLGVPLTAFLHDYIALIMQRKEQLKSEPAPEKT